MTTQTRARLRAALGVGAVWLVLQGLLALLWDRPAGLLQIGPPRRDTPDLAALTSLPWLVLLVSIAVARLWRSRPGALTYFRTFVRCLGLYAGVVLVAAVLEQCLDFHFATSIGIHAALGVLLLGACFGGTHRPMRHLRLGAPPRPWADVLSTLLLVLAYVEFIWDKAIWRLDLDVTQPAWWALMTTFVELHLLLAWALLHSRAVTWLGRGIERLERSSEADATQPRFLPVLAAHLLAAATILLLCRGVHHWILDLWHADAWIYPQDGPFVYLGVDWYFVSTTEIVRAAEIAIPLAVALVAGPVLTKAAADR